MRKILLLLLLFPITATITAQSIKGRVENNKGEALTGANIRITNSFEVRTTGSDGNFIFENIKQGEYILNVSFIGYETKQEKISVSDKDLDIIISLEESENLTEEIVVSALRAGRNTPVAASEIDNSQLKKSNLGQDIPYLLELMPSITSTSDAGAGVGYTKLSVRGTDLTRINVTVNGIPLNDAESHGVWWVDLPDLASSTENIQIQRGVGTSTNGAAAFGANINIQTNLLRKEAYSQLAGSFGSFGTYKTSIKAGTGLINNHFAFDLRLSKIHSDGFIDRAKTDLESYFASGTYSAKKTMIKLNVISGQEDTYQSWWGVPKARLNNDLADMQRYSEHWLYSEEETNHMLNSDSRTYNYYTYDNEVDNYKQSHYQIFISRKINSNLNINLAYNFTKGKGYYEQYRNDDDFADYGLEPIVIGTETISSSDLIRRKWLDNDLHIITYSIEYQNNRTKATIGGAYQDYFGRHYGEIIWAQYAGNSNIRERWYYNTGDKKEFNIFGKFEYLFFEQLNIYADLQYRTIDYTLDGPDDDLRDISQKHNYDFFNPKFGLNYLFAENQHVYFTFGIGNREPARDNFKDANEGQIPTNETLTDYELGYTFSEQNAKLNLNLYYMDYNNQMVNTGKINNVGNPIMTNIPVSYRRGIEISGGIKLNQIIEWQANATFSQNKIKNYIEYTDNWETGVQDEIPLGETNISFSPEIIAGSQILFKPLKGLEIGIISKYVGEQYIDNSSAKDRMLDAYFVNNVRFNYHFETKFTKGIDLQLLVNNIFSEEYETNAWVYRYYYENAYHNMDGYFPQAGINFLAGIAINF